MADPLAQHSGRHRTLVRRPLFLLGIGVFAGLVLGYALGADAEPPAPLMAPPALPAVTQPTATTIPGDGAYWVGPDVHPGVYRATSNTTPCSWKRARDPSGEHHEVIADETTTGTSYVQLEKGEFFVTDSCTTWRRVRR
jgi:hypothetical protein